MVGGGWKLTGMGVGDEFRYFIASGKVFESNALPTYSDLLENRVFGDVPLCRWVGQVFSLTRTAFTSTALARYFISGPTLRTKRVRPLRNVSF
jgi:hypothetical protein